MAEVVPPIPEVLSEEETDAAISAVLDAVADPENVTKWEAVDMLHASHEALRAERDEIQQALNASAQREQVRQERVWAAEARITELEGALHRAPAAIALTFRHEFMDRGRIYEFDEADIRAVLDALLASPIPPEAASTPTCPTCGGAGRIVDHLTALTPETLYEPCPACKGTGRAASTSKAPQ